MMQLSPGQLLNDHNSDGDIMRLAWAANLLILIAAIGFALSPAPQYAPYAFGVFFLAHVILAFSAWKFNDKSLLSLSAAMVAVDCFPILRALQ